MVGSNCYLFFDPSVGNFLIEYRGPFIEEIARVDYACGVAINETLGVIAVSENDIDRLRRDVPSIVYIDIRTMLVLQEISPSFVDNINNIKLNPYLDLTGRGVIVGIIDTGINYLNPEFIREDGTSRIISLWDQNIRSDEFQDDYNMYIGKVFTNEQINSAIQASRNNEDPFTIVPSRDEVGHGTKVAGIIGARGENPDLEGVANGCDFVIVKLFQSTNFQRLIRENNMDPPPVYNMSELFTALEFLRNEFLRLKRPMVIYIGVGSTFGSHDGANLISRYLMDLTNYGRLCIVVGSGNEGNAQGHARGLIDGVGEISTQEFRIPREMKNFSLNIWLQRPNRASINITSPTGEASGVIVPQTGRKVTYNYIFTNTSVTVSYFTPEHFTGTELINVQFNGIKPGIWRIDLIGFYIVDGRYDIWLPPNSTLPAGVEFLTPDPENTLVVPSSTINIISVAYLGPNNSITPTSGKGFNTNGFINPIIATTGVDILTTDLNGNPSTLSGASAATAIIAGACALLLEWGIVKGNDHSMSAIKIRSYLIYGASRNPNFTYPNVDIGYGEFNLLGTFNFIARIFPNLLRKINLTLFNPYNLEKTKNRPDTNNHLLKLPKKDGDKNE